MRFPNVKLILAREIRDQLRDRRTLFMIFVLPLLLYPLLGMSFFQVSQFMHEQPVHVLVIGVRGLADPGEPPQDSQDEAVEPAFPPALFENNQFDRNLFTKQNRVELLDLEFAREEPSGVTRETAGQRAAALRRRAAVAVQVGEYDAALYFPHDFADKLDVFRQAIEDGRSPSSADVPQPEVIYTTANEKSQAAFDRLSRVLDRWRQKVVECNLSARNVPIAAARPFELGQSDVAEKTPYHGAAIWSKILPVLLLLWAMTGAFYPAVDLCAGEKERGTLETLLSSPAQRSEIVLGKLLTIMLFSMITAALNLVSVGFTGWLVLRHMPQFGPPPPMAIVWLAIALVPVSALFSALCLALAAFARSTKEGQYYLMPLLLITMPLAVLPMAPGVELNLGNSLIPVTGVVLLLRSALEGSYLPTLQFLPVVAAVTLAACLLAIRWAVDQFNSESVLFSESERLDMGLWLRHLMRDRQPTPGVAAAVFCGVLILMLKFFLSFVLPAEADDFGDFAKTALITQLVMVAAPALLMTRMLTSSPRQTLLLKRPPWLAVPAAVVLAVVLHPAAIVLGGIVQQLYPFTDQVTKELAKMQALIQGAPWWQVVLLMAVTPAIVEELAFRGFILSGFRHLGHKWRAIIYSAIFFGLSHMILQQSLVVCLVGVVVGYLAIQSGSLLPGMVFHLIYNGLMVSVGRISAKAYDRLPLLNRLGTPTEGGFEYHWLTVAAGCTVALALLAWFGRLSYAKSAEEELQASIDGRLGTEKA